MNNVAIIATLEEHISKLETELLHYKAERTHPASESTENTITVNGVPIAWQTDNGQCTFGGLPVAMMWVDTTLAGLLSGVQAMVGTERFALALQSEGRKSVDADWEVISLFDDFEAGFEAIANIATVAGWGRWQLISLDREKRTCVFRCYGSWEGRFQKTLGVHWGANMVAGKLAGYAGRLFNTNCWADQTHFLSKGDPFDEFFVHPSSRSVETEVENLLTSDQATRADMAVALKKLKQEVDDRIHAEQQLRLIQTELAQRVSERTEALAAANEELRRSELRFRSIIESSPMGVHIYELDENDNLIFQGANPAAEMSTNIDHDKLLGKTIEQAFPMVAETEIPKKCREVCHTGIPWNTSLVDDDDEKVKGLFEIYAFKTGEKTIAILFLDVSERVKSEREKEALMAELHRSKKMEALGLLAGGVAHDLNNILSGLVGYPELLSAMLPPDSPLRRPLSVIESSGLQASAVVQDLLTIARGAATTRKVVHLNELVEEYLLSPEFNKLRENHQHVAIITELDPDLLCISVSPVHIRKVLMNLVVNAMEAQKTAGDVIISTENRYMDQPLSGYDSIKVGEYVVLSVRDAGPGIDPEDLEHIFEPFYTKKQLGRSGTGLGLAVVWNCVKDHGGYIDIVSSPEGSCFNIYLNATRVCPDDEPTSEPPEMLRGSGERVLVVDDEPNQRELICRILNHMGYETQSVPDGIEACRFVEKNPVDLLVLDMIMPASISGLETYRRLLGIRPGLPAIIVSGYAETEDVKRTQALGAGAYLKKPVTMSSLAQAVHEELEKQKTPSPGTAISAPVSH